MKKLIKKALIITLCLILPLTTFTACEMVGAPGETGKSAYETWLDQGHSGTEEDFLTWLKGEDGDNGGQGLQGETGKSAYEIWLEQGHSGTEEDFLTWLKGEDGDNGGQGLQGETGKSAYEIWLDQGHSGTEEDFLTWLKGEDGDNGKSAYELYCEKYGYTGTEDEWLAEVYEFLSKMSTEELYAHASARTVFLVCQNYLGNKVSCGSGFFIDEDGTIVTAYHVIDGVAKVKAYTEDGTEYEVVSVLGYDDARDLAILKISSETPFKYFELETENITAGESVYSFGAPLGLAGSFSSGVIACPVLENTASSTESFKEIQYTAPVSPGSSGGPIFNAYGKVLGAVTYGLTDGNSLSFATCVSELEKVDTSIPTTVKELYETKYFYLIKAFDNLYIETEDFSDDKLSAYTIKNGDTIYGTNSSNDGDAFSITIAENDQFLTIAYVVPTEYTTPQLPMLHKNGELQNVSTESWSSFETEDTVVYYIIFDVTAGDYQAVIKGETPSETPYYFYAFYRSASAWETTTVKNIMPQ